MATTRGKPALLDTNVLIDATDVGRARHRAARALVERRSGLVICAQVVREFLAVSTRSVEHNGLGLSIADALDNLAVFRQVARLLPEEKPVLPHLLALLRSVPCQGKSIHDAAIVATMWTHRVRMLVTSNPRHFARFGSTIEIVELN